MELNFLRAMIDFLRALCGAVPLYFGEVRGKELVFSVDSQSFSITLWKKRVVRVFRVLRTLHWNACRSVRSVQNESSVKRLCYSHSAVCISGRCTYGIGPGNYQQKRVWLFVRRIFTLVKLGSSGKR
jgi:hypothetical protein